MSRREKTIMSHVSGRPPALRARGIFTVTRGTDVGRVISISWRAERRYRRKPLDMSWIGIDSTRRKTVFRMRLRTERRPLTSDDPKPLA